MFSSKMAFSLLCCVLMTLTAVYAKPPNILFIAADDLGYNDIGYMNPDIISPNLDKLAKEGIIMNQSYVQPACSPSRSAWMSGYQPYHTGLQHSVILARQAAGLPANLTTLPQRLKSLGYKTHMIGKWHLGFCKKDFIPSNRGFDTFLGYYAGAEDFYDHKLYHVKNTSIGLDFHFNEKPLRNYEGVYSTYIFGARAVEIIRNHERSSPMFLYLPFQAVHWPIEVPKHYEKLYPDVQNTKRRIYSGMVSAMDEAVGNITRALKERGLENDTLIIFTTDNGGHPPSAGNNWPLRGAKTTLWEGGTRGVAFVHGKMLKSRGKYAGLFHAADWYPTIVSAAGGDAIEGIDGINQWRQLSGMDDTHPRTEMVYNIDMKAQNGAIRDGDYKLMIGSAGTLNDWYPVPTKDKSTIPEVCEDHVDRTLYFGPQLRLYNLRLDPNERHDIAKSQPAVVKKLYLKFLKYKATEVPPQWPKANPKADPKYFGGVWSPGWC